MRCKKILIILLTILILILNNYSVFAEQNLETNLDLTAKSVILIDNKTNKILYQKEPAKKSFPASTTKIMTAILALEYIPDLDTPITASYNAIMSIPEGYSTAKIEIGETLTASQLLEVLMVYSANDSANILAEYIGGSIESFVSIMNTKANEIGLKNTHFTNSYGKHDDEHYTNALDLAKLLQYCIKNENFRKYAGLASCAIPATNKNAPRLYSSTDSLIDPNSDLYLPYLTVGKTGFTSQAGNCLVSCSYKDDLELICVVLGCDGEKDRFIDTKKLYEYGYNNFSIKEIIHENNVATNIKVRNSLITTEDLDLVVADSIFALVENNESNNSIITEISLADNLTAPIEEGSILGKINYKINDISYTTNLLASRTVEQSQIIYYFLFAFIALILIIIVLIFLLRTKTNIDLDNEFDTSIDEITDNNSEEHNTEE